MFGIAQFQEQFLHCFYSLRHVSAYRLAIDVVMEVMHIFSKGSFMNLTFRGPFIVIYSYNKTN